jgi:hypothetical protein
MNCGESPPGGEITKENMKEIIEQLNDSEFIIKSITLFFIH